MVTDSEYTDYFQHVLFDIDPNIKSAYDCHDTANDRWTILQLDSGFPHQEPTQIQVGDVLISHHPFLHRLTRNRQESS